MGYRILDVMAEFTDRSTGKRSIMCEIAADTASDLPSNSATLDYILGSYATAIDTGDIYKINSAGTWIQQPSTIFSNVYTKSEIDTLLGAITADITALDNSKVSLLDVFRGKIITSGKDLNTSEFAAAGIYYCENAATAGTLVNSPVTASGFVMLVYTSGNRYRIVLPTGAGATTLYVQTITGGGSTFNSWYYANMTIRP